MDDIFFKKHDIKLILHWPSYEGSQVSTHFHHDSQPRLMKRISQVSTHFGYNPQPQRMKQISQQPYSLLIPTKPLFTFL